MERFKEAIRVKENNFTPTFNPPPSRGRRGKGFLPPNAGEGQDGGDIIRKRAKNLRKNPTDAENKLWRYLRLRQAEGYKFRRQQPIEKYIVDFVCLEKKLVIELDGGQHNGRVDYDKERTVWLGSRGYRVLRFWNNEVFENIDIVLDLILRELKKGDKNTPTFNPPPDRGGKQSQEVGNEVI